MKEGIIGFEDCDSFVELAPEQPVSMNFMGFGPEAFKLYNKYFEEFIKGNYNNPKAEFYMPTVMNNMVANNEGRVKILSTPAIWFGVTYKEDKEGAIASLNELIAKGKYPEKLW